LKIKEQIAGLAAEAGVILDGGLGAVKFPLPPEKARQRFKQEIDVPHGYGDRRGHIECREAVARWYWDRFAMSFDPKTEVRVLEGSREIYPYLFKWLFGLKEHKGREKTVVLAKPYYGGHNTAVKWAGGKPFFIQSDREHNFFDGLEQKLVEGLRPLVVVVSYVSNPAGLTCTLNDFRRLVRLANQYDFKIASDRAYGELQYKGSCPSIYEAAGDWDVVLCESFTASKMFQAAQWRVGPVVGRPEVMDGIMEQKADLSEGVCTAAQLAFATALNDCRDFLPEICHIYSNRADFAVVALREAGWDTACRPDGGMFLWLPLPTKIAQAGLDAVAFCKRMAALGIVMWPDVMFGDKEPRIRFCLREENEVVERACRAISDILPQ